MAKLITMKQKENEQYVNLYPQTDWSQVNGADAQIVSVTNSTDIKVANLQGQINQKQDASTAVNQGNIGNYVKVVAGYYTGDGSESRFITLGFTPKAVYVVQNYGYPFGGYPTYSPSQNYFYGGLAVTGSPAITPATKVNMVNISTNGFYVYVNNTLYDSSTYGANTNEANIIFNYVAFL